MEAFTSQLVVAVWILALCSEARVLSKPCTRGELVAVVNSSRLFGFPVECRNACEVLAVSRDSVAACNKGMSEETGWKRCETSTRDALLLQDSKKEHLCILATRSKHIHGGSSCTGEFINECHSLKENSLRPRRSAEMVDNETHSRSQNVHTWAIVISSVVTLMLLVLVSVLCVGSNKNKTEPTSSKASANSAIQNATAVNQPSNHHDSTNQANHNEGENVNGRAKMGDQGQHLYVNVQLEARSKSDREAGSQSPDENQDQQQPVNLDQEQPVANQDEQLVDQNVDLQAAEPVQDQPQQAVNQPQQAPQAAANGDVVDQQRQDAEKTKIPYGVVTIHSDQSNTPADNNYAEVRSEEGEGTQDTMYDCVNYDVINDSSSSKVNENGYSTVVRDQPTQPEQPRRDRMYESVDEAFNKKTIPSAPVFNGDDDEGLEQDDMYEKVPDSFRQKVASFSQAEAPRLPPMNLRSRKPSDDITTVQQQQRSSSAATLPSGGLPSSPLTQHRGRLQSSPSVKAPSYPAPSVPPPAFRAPNPPPDTEDIEDDENALYARPEPASNRSMSTSLVREKVNLEEARKKASTLPVKAMLSHGGPRSPVILGPLPALPESTKVSSSSQPKEDEEETEDPGYDTTQSVMINPDYDHLEPDEMQDRGHEVEQQRPEQQQQEEPLKSPKSPSTVKHDGKGYALPSTKKAEENYAIINLTQKRMSQRKKKQTTGDGGSAAVASESPIPPSLPPPLDPDLVDEDMRTEPSVPPRLPQSEELVEPNKIEPPYAKVNKGKIADLEQPSGTEEYGDDDEIDPYAAVDIQVLGGVPEVQLTTEREYDSIDNVMPPQPQQPSVNVILSDVEGEYACVRSDATISPIPTHPIPDPATGSVAAHDTSADDTTATTRELAPDDEHSTNSSAEHTEL